MDERKLATYSAIALLFYIISFLLYFRAEKIENDYQFKGIVKKVTYDDKHFPEVVIGAKTYVVTFPTEDFNNKIEAGDSLIKIKNSKIYKLVKFKTKAVIFSK